MYSITACVEEHTVNGIICHQIPIFYLHKNVQGIVSADHAEVIAKDVLNPMKHPCIKVHCHATWVEL